MSPEKDEQTKVDNTNKEAPVETAEAAKKPKKKRKRVTYFCVKAPLVHPFQDVRIPTNPPGVQLDKDNWLEVQIEAGLIKPFKR